MNTHTHETPTTTPKHAHTHTQNTHHAGLRSWKRRMITKGDGRSCGTHNDNSSDDNTNRRCSTMATQPNGDHDGTTDVSEEGYNVIAAVVLAFKPVVRVAKGSSVVHYGVTKAAVVWKDKGGGAGGG